MSYQQAFRSDLDLVYTRFGSSVRLADVRQCALHSYRDPRYRPGMRELIDFRAAVDVDPDLRFDTIREIWDAQSTWIQRLRGDAQVVLVGSSDLAFGLIRMYVSLADHESQQLRPCRDWNTACKYLGIDPEIELLADVAGG